MQPAGAGTMHFLHIPTSPLVFENDFAHVNY